MKSLNSIRFFAWIDIALGVILALPTVGGFSLQFLHQLVEEDVLVLNTYHFVLMQILGIMIVLWGLVRLLRTADWQIHYDCIARVPVVVYLAFYGYNGQKVLFFFIIIELLGFYQLRFISPKKN